MRISKEKLFDFLEENYLLYNQPDFIQDDPISIPHSYSKKQDIEISGFFAAVFAWGQRKTIINKTKELMALMDDAPHDFILNHSDDDLKPFLNFKHRTFNSIDTLYFIDFLKRFYSEHKSLEEGFSKGNDMETRLTHFHNTFFNIEYAPSRTKKHIATPERKSTCKRLNMYLRWMVRKDDNGVDFGIWDSIPISDLICPCDVHVEKVARAYNLIKRKQTDWLTAVELTKNLKKFDKKDPVKYDFALFGLSVNGGF